MSAIYKFPKSMSKDQGLEVFDLEFRTELEIIFPPQGRRYSLTVCNFGTGDLLVGVTPDDQSKVRLNDSTTPAQFATVLTVATGAAGQLNDTPARAIQLKFAADPGSVKRASVILAIFP